MAATAAVSRKHHAADPVAIDKKHYKIEFENDKVRVLRIKYGPREKSPMHSHPAFVAVFLTPHHSRHVLADGSVKEIRGNKGDVIYMESTEHEPQNMSDEPFELIGIELKH